MSEPNTPYGVSFVAFAPEEIKVGDRVEVIIEDSRFFGKIGVVSRITENGIISVCFSKRELASNHNFASIGLRKLPDTISFEDKDNPMERQVGGNHYDMPIQPVEFIERNGLGFCVGNAVKYLCRYKKKNGKQDLEKAKHYIDMLIQMEYPD